MSLGLLLVSPLAGDVELEVTSQNSCNTSFLRIVHELLAALEITTSPTLNSTVGTFPLRLANLVAVANRHASQHKIKQEMPLKSYAKRQT